jgi:FecR protein
MMRRHPQPRTIPAALCRAVWATVALALALTAARAALAQGTGTVAELDGTVEIGHAGTWAPAVIGATVAPGDTVRTHRPGRLAILFQDDSVVTVGDDTTLVIDAQRFDRSTELAHSVMHLLRGRMRALVGPYYERPGNEFRVETATAVVGVRGTEFVIVFDPVAEVTDAVGVSGRAEVHSVLDRVGHTVFITAREATEVTRGQYPTPARRLDDEEFRLYLQGLDFIGHGKSESLAAVQPLLTGSGVPPQDRLANLPAPPMPVAPGGVNGYAPTAPGETSLDAFNQQDAGGLSSQPPSVVDATDGFTQGQVGIHF